MCGRLVCKRLLVFLFSLAPFLIKLRRLPSFPSIYNPLPQSFSNCFDMSSERFDRFVSYIPYVVAFALVCLYFIFVLPRIQDYVVVASGYITAAQKAAHAQEFPRGCSPVTRYNRPVFEIYGLY